MQVHRELSWLYEQTGARVVSCVGGHGCPASSSAHLRPAAISWWERQAG